MGAKEEGTSLIQFKRYDGVIINCDTRSRIVSHFRYKTRFTPNEWRVLKALYENRPKAVERKDLLKAISGNEKDLVTATRTIDMHIAAIRRKLKPFKICSIDTVYGHGYRLLVNKGL